jgi:hypothetical protein
MLDPPDETNVPVMANFYKITFKIVPVSTQQPS